MTTTPVAATRPSGAADRFAGTVALVAGDPADLGRHLAWSLADEGADVGVLALPDGPGEELAQTVDGIRTRGRRACGAGWRPAADPLGAGEAAVAEVERELGPLGVVVVAARRLTPGAAHELTEDAWDDVLAVNLHATFAVLRAAVPRLAQRGAGRVVVVTGEEARLGAAGRSHVAAAGWATIGFAKSLAQEVADAGVLVNVVVAGPLDEAATATVEWGRHVTGTDGRGEVEHALRIAHPISEAWVDPADVAATVRFLAAPDGPRTTGAVIDVTLGASARNSA